jgi:A/G-specific adenine glycosylase
MTSRIVDMARPQPSPARVAVEIAAPPAGIPAIRRAVLAWYRPRPHDYPWRSDSPDPYAVLVSEVMLQQTQAARVAPAYRTFLERFPDVRALASAGRAELLRTWGGLGYPRRALALREAARSIVGEHGGEVPRDPEVLRGLPGVGPYTAAAVASIAFGVAVAAVDTNVRRITARVLYGAEPDDLPAPLLVAGANALVDPRSPGEWNQAAMDLGRFVCRPVPRCDTCPVAARCRAVAEGGPRQRSARRRPAFDGSMRQARGRVLAALRDGDGPIPLGALADATGLPADRARTAASALAADGIVTLTRSDGSDEPVVGID